MYQPPSLVSKRPAVADSTGVITPPVIGFGSGHSGGSPPEPAVPAVPPMPLPAVLPAVPLLPPPLPPVALPAVPPVLLPATLLPAAPAVLLTPPKPDVPPTGEPVPAAPAEFCGRGSSLQLIAMARLVRERTPGSSVRSAGTLFAHGRFRPAPWDWWPGVGGRRHPGSTRRAQRAEGRSRAAATVPSAARDARAARTIPPSPPINACKKALPGRTNLVRAAGTLRAHSVIRPRGPFVPAMLVARCRWTPDE
jgi:hypothetical protein